LVDDKPVSPYFTAMSILPILEVPDPRLKVISSPVTVFDAELKKLAADMFETMYDAPGIGLAAIQVGVPKRLLVIDLQEPAEHDHQHGEHCNHGHEVIRDPRVFVNPEILDPSEDHSVYNEGCLSVPDQYAEVERPARIRARWQDLDGKVHEEEMIGMMATCLQHEMDHLEGILFIDHLSRLKRQMVLKKLEKQRKLAA
jgi:peptide deformylase